MKNKKILISGGGIAGLTVAYWLHRYGFQPTIIERAGEIRTDGYMIDFAGTGWDIANKMGLIPQLQQKNHDLSKIIYKNAAGKTTAEMSMRDLYAASGAGDKHFTLDRADLVDILFAAVKENVTVKENVAVRFDTSIEQVHQSAEAVTVTFADGSQETFALLIGADGIHSNVRKLVFGPEEAFAHFLGYYAAAFYLPNTWPDFKDNFINYVEPDRQAGVYPLDNNQLLAYFTYKGANEGYIPPAARKAALCKHFASAGWRTPELLNALADTAPIYLDMVTQIKMPSWSQGRVTLIGDAAYCLTLISGQGASMAMAGAYLLAEELSRQDDYRVALANYERRLRPHIEETQVKAQKFAPSFVPNSRLKIFITNQMIKLMDLAWVSNFVGKQFNVTSLFDTGVIEA